MKVGQHHFWIVWKICLYFLHRKINEDPAPLGKYLISCYIWYVASHYKLTFTYQISGKMSPLFHKHIRPKNAIWCVSIRPGASIPLHAYNWQTFSMRRRWCGSEKATTEGNPVSFSCSSVSRHLFHFLSAAAAAAEVSTFGAAKRARTQTDKGPRSRACSDGDAAACPIFSE